MKRFQLCLLMAAAIFMAGPVYAYTLNFDELSTPNNDGGQLWGTVPITYNGFNWAGSWEVADQNSYKSTYNNTYNFASPTKAVYNDTGSLVMTLTNGSSFNFESASFSTWAQNNAFQSFSATTLTITGYQDNVMVGSPITFNLKSNMFELQNINLLNIDEVRFQANASGKWWLMDNFTYTNAPIPGAVWLLGTGIVGLVAMRRKFQK